MDYKIFSSNRSIIQSSAIHPIIATADKSSHFVPVGVTSARLNFCLLLQHYPKREPNMFLVVSFLIVCCQLIFQFLSAVLLIKAPNENKQNTSKQVKF